MPQDEDPTEVEEENGDAKEDPPQSEIEAALAAGTPPTYWSETYVPSRFSDRGEDDCGIRLSLPNVTVPRPTIGEISGLDTVRTDLAEISGIVDSIIHTVRAELPSAMNRILDDYLGPVNPNPPGGLPSVPGMGLPWLQMRISVLVGRALQKLANFPPRLVPTTPVVPTPRFSPRIGQIRIGVTSDQEVSIQIFSRMTSSYSFGRGRGTSHGTSHPSITPALALGQDRPWFAKAMLRSSQITLPIGIPFPMISAPNFFIAQLGVAGELTAIQGGSAELSPMTHGMVIPVQFNGNYGQVRVLVIPPAPCKVSWGDFLVTGPYESDVVALEDSRFRTAEITRDATLQTMTTIQNTLVMLGITATVIPFFGAAVNLLLRRVVLLLEDKKNAFRTALNTANNGQRARNYTLAEQYPERGPVGGAEDDPR